jgi:hypothetical protein
MASLLLSASALATPARQQALLGNNLFEDDQDSYLFPALAAWYGPSVSLHIGGGGPQAGLLFGEDWVWGVSYGTPIAYDDIARTDENLNRTLLRPSRLLTFLLARKLEDGGLLGFAVNPSFGITRSFPVSGPIANALSFELELIAGYSVHREDMSSDTALAISYHRFQQRSAGVTTAETSHIPSLALRHRTIVSKALGEKVDLGVFGEVARREESFFQNEPFTSRASIARWVFNAGVGPRFRPLEMVTVAPLVELIYVNVAGGVDTAGLEFSRLTFPSFRMAAEITPFPWLVVRGGIARRFDVVVARPQTGGETDSTSDGFVFSTGAGVRFDRLVLDATLSTALLLQGPSVIGGGSPGLFGSLSLRYALQ